MGLGSFKVRWWFPIEAALGVFASFVRALTPSTGREERIRCALENIAKQPCKCSSDCEPCDPCLAAHTLEVES